MDWVLDAQRCLARWAAGSNTNVVLFSQVVWAGIYCMGKHMWIKRGVDLSSTF